MAKLTPIQNRLIKGSVEIHQNLPEKPQVSYQHKVLAQTCMPYRNPGDNVRRWIKKSRDAALVIKAGELYHPRKNEIVEVGLPFGPKARILMIFLHHEAIKTQSPIVNVEDNMTAFIKRVHHSEHVNGAVIKAYKEQLTRLSASHYTMAISLSDDHAINESGQIVKGFDVWFPKDPNQRVMWSSTIRLSDEYFDSLKRYLVPLDERAVGNLAHSAMGLDIYTWLAQRLHWINTNEPQFVSWQNLKEQFGEGYARIDKFKQVFRKTLSMVLTQYPAAYQCVTEERNKGYWLKQAPRPVSNTKTKALT